MSNILIELTAAVDDLGTEETFYLSTAAFTTSPTDTPANTSFQPAIVDPGSIGIHAFSDGRTGGRTTLEIGEIVIENADGAFDVWRDYGFDGKPAVIRYVGAGYEALRTVDYWSQKTVPVALLWQSVCWSPELSLFAAVAASGTGNRVMTSPDGRVWTARTSAVDASWNEVVWSPELSLFCAIASTSPSDFVMTSPDGINWTARTSPSNTWNSVYWSPELGLFAAIARGGGIGGVMTSPDGINWTSRTCPTGQWTSIVWSPTANGTGLFCGVSFGGELRPIVTSDDGITWTARLGPGGNNTLQSVCWSPELSLFAAVSDTGVRVMTSPDGITWTARMSAADNSWRAIAWSPELSLFAAVAASGTGNRVMTSPDGITWTARTSAANDGWASIVWSPALGLFVAVAPSGTYQIMISPDQTSYPSGYPVLLHGTVESIEIDVSQVVLRLRDKSYIFDRPALTTVYAGTNVLPAGLEGTADDLKGTPKPQVYGKVLNIAPPCVNTSKLTYQPNNGVLASIDAVYDQGAAITFGSDYATSALLQAATPGAGTYDTCIAEGYFRLGSSPAGQVTADVTAGAAESDRTTAQVLSQIAVAAGLASTDVWVQTLAETGRANAATVGIFIDDASTTFADAMDEIAASIGAYWGFDIFGYLRMGVLAEEAGAAIAQITEEDILADGGFEVLPPKDNGIPIYSARINHTKNYTVQTTDIAGSVTDARRAFLGQDYRTTVATDSTVLLKHELSGVDLTDTLLSDVVGIVDNNWLPIAWSPELSLFAAVAASGTGNRVMTSPDGITWTIRTSAADNNWYAIAWSPELSLFAAVAFSGTGNRVMTSPDGITWSAYLDAADYESRRRLALFDVTRSIYRVPLSSSFFATIPIRMLDPVELSMPRFDLTSGKLLSIIGYELDLSAATTTLNLWS